jgi:hypothetical protein
MAYRENLKGITIYRDRSRPKQPLASGNPGVLLNRYLSAKKLFFNKKTS